MCLITLVSYGAKRSFYSIPVPPWRIWDLGGRGVRIHTADVYLYINPPPISAGGAYGDLLRGSALQETFISIYKVLPGEMQCVALAHARHILCVCVCRPSAHVSVFSLWGV
jgi:hypothetical protein